MGSTNDLSIIIMCSVWLGTIVQPSSFYFKTLSVNGSSAVGRCSNVTTGPGIGDDFSRCDTPTTSVLFDGNIPTLTGLDGDMWASQLLTLQTTVDGDAGVITSNFTSVRNYVGLERIELVMFNCPEKGISVQRIVTTASGFLSSPEIFDVPNITSCDSLVRVCISQVTTQPVIALQFDPPPGSTWVHLAEVVFYGSGSTCPPDTIITTVNCKISTNNN
jgi:hypothetical protein